jgi:argininosuccinate lyase
MTEKMWSGRLRGALDPGFEQWQRSFPFDQRLLPEELAASRAYAEALSKAGALSAEERGLILGGLEKVEKKVSAEPRLLETSDAEDVHHFVEQQLVALVGDAGSKIHTGRSRNEQIATDLRLFVRGKLDETGALLAELIGVFVARAKTLGETAMPAYTHLQRAEPVLAAHWLLAYVEMFFRDAERLADCRRRVSVLPLGSGAVAGSAVALDREAMAKALGFERVSANSMDATSDRDFALEFIHALSFIALHLSRWAEEMTLFSTAEFGFVELPDTFATGSSAMPQKKNPDALELLRGKTGRVAGAAVALFTTLKGLPLAYNKDMQESQEPLFDASDTVSAALEIAAGLLRAVSFNTERMQQAAQAPFLNATAAANYLARRGVPFRQAHAVIGQAVRYCIEKKKTLETLTPEELRQFSPAFGDDFRSALELRAVLAGHDVVGGTAPPRVKQALAEAEQRLKALAEGTHAHA